MDNQTFNKENIIIMLLVAVIFIMLFTGSSSSSSSDPCGSTISTKFVGTDDPLKIEQDRKDNPFFVGSTFGAPLDLDGKKMNISSRFVGTDDPLKIEQDRKDNPFFVGSNFATKVKTGYGAPLDLGENKMRTEFGSPLDLSGNKMNINAHPFSFISSPSTYFVSK